MGFNKKMVAFILSALSIYNYYRVKSGILKEQQADAFVSGDERNGTGPVVGGNELISKFEQNEKGQHELEFVHITKTGGSSIEVSASRHGIAWGACKFSQSKACRDLAKYSNIAVLKPQSWRCRVAAAPWHCPPGLFADGRNRYAGVDTFAVVRNPYHRIVSQYYYLNRNRKDKWNDVGFMNKWIVKELERVKRGLGRCIPMHQYIYKHTPPRNNRPGKVMPVVKHVLKQENLTQEFHALMKTYNLPITLERKNVRNEEALLGVWNLTKNTLEQINQWALLDFKYFGYEKLDPSSVNASTLI